MVPLRAAGEAVLVTTRLTLRREDGRVFLDRWGIESRRIGGVFIHRMSAPDPGIDLHDHPWAFTSVILWGGYLEQRAPTKLACAWALAASLSTVMTRGVLHERRPLSVRRMPQTHCHRITGLTRKTSWSLLIHGPVRKKASGSAWGFYTPDGYVDHHDYESTPSGAARAVVQRRGWFRRQVEHFGAAE